MSLRVHTDASGIVWYGDNRRTYVCSNQTPEDFVEGAGVRGSPLPAASFSVIGCHQNAELIVRLCLDRKPADQPDVTVYAPFGLSNKTAVPEVLHRLRQPGCVLGSSHQLSAADFIAYALVFELTRGTTSIDELVRRLASRHPAWPAFSFLSPCDQKAACRVLAHYLDPRWFVDPRRPARQGRLRAYFGLSEQNAAWFLRGVQPCRNHARARDLFDVWWMEDELSPRAPGAFLRREYAAYEGSREQALLRSSARLLNLVGRLWLASASKHPEVRLDPALFFRRPSEARAFAQHASV